MSKLINKIIEERQYSQGSDFSESDISDYLLKNPDYFIRHREILLKLKIPPSITNDSQNSPNSPIAINLWDKHREVLEARVATLEYKYKKLVDVGNSNQKLSDKIHSLECNLAKTITLSDFIACLKKQVPTRLGLVSHIWLWDRKIDFNSTVTFSNLPSASKEVIDFTNSILPLQVFREDTPAYISPFASFTLALPLAITKNVEQDRSFAKGLLVFVDEYQQNPGDMGISANYVDEDFLLLGRFAEVCARMVEGHLLRM